MRNYRTISISSNQAKSSTILSLSSYLLIILVLLFAYLQTNLKPPFTLIALLLLLLVLLLVLLLALLLLLLTSLVFLSFLLLLLFCSYFFSCVLESFLLQIRSSRDRPRWLYLLLSIVVSALAVDILKPIKFFAPLPGT